MAQAGALERRELVDARQGDRDAGHDGPLAVPGEQRRMVGRQQAVRARRGQPVGRPGDEVAGGEERDHGGGRGVRPPRPTAAARTATAIGSVDGSIIAAIIVTQRPMNGTSAPGSVPGPSSMPRIRHSETAQVTSATARSAATVRAAPARGGGAPPAGHATAREAYRKVVS